MIDFKKKFAFLFETPVVNRSVAVYREKARPLVVAASKVAGTSIFAMLVGLKAIAFGPYGHSLIVPMFVATVGLLSFASPIGGINTWYVGPEGWTIFSGTPSGTGTACNNSSSTYTGTCVVAATNTVAASFTASRSGTTLTIASGAPPSVGHTVVRTDGTVLGTILSGSNPTFTVSTSGTIATEAMTSSIGNDTTCAAQAMPVGLTSATLSSFTPTLPCFSPVTAQGRMRDNKPDWVVLKKGDEWCGGWSGAGSGSFTKNGLSTSAPQLFTAYGVGARPKFKTCGQNVPCALATSTVRGRYAAMVGIECYVEYMDPASPDFLGVMVTATATSGSNVLTGVSNVTGDYANLTTSFYAYGSGIVTNAVTSINTGAGTITLTANASFSGTMQVQFVKTNSIAYLSMTNSTTLFILEDDYFNYTTFSINPLPVSETTETNFRIRRNIIANPYTYAGAGGSPFLGNTYVGPSVVEENFNYHVCWNETVWSAPGSNQCHAWYIHDPYRSLSFVRNITAQSSGNAGQIRNGGEIYDNLSINNPIGWNQVPFALPLGGTVSYNTVTGSGETILGLRIASAATAVGNAVLHVPGVINSGISTFLSRSVDNLDNPGSITGSSSSLGADTITMNTNVAAGQRGNGVQIGDRIQISVYGGQGDNTRASGGILLATGPGVVSGFYPVGTSTFYVQASFPIPAWVVPGMKIQAGPPYGTAFPPGDTTVASIAGDRLSLTPADPSIYSSFTAHTSGNQLFIDSGTPPAGAPQTIVRANGTVLATIFSGTSSPFTLSASVGTIPTEAMTCGIPLPAFEIGANGYFLIYTPATDVSTYWPTNVMTQNIYTNNLSKGKAGGASFAIAPQPGTQGASLPNNYIYNWNPDPTLNVLDQSGNPGKNVLTPQLRSCGGTGGLTCGNDKPNLYVEAYEATLNTNNITASIFTNAFGGTVLRVTSGSVSRGIRVFGTGVIPALILSDLGGGDWLIDEGQVVSSRAMYTGSLANFYACARAQSKDNWNPACTAHAVNEFFRAEVGIASQPVTYH